MRKHGLIPFPEELVPDVTAGKFSFLAQQVQAFERQLLLDAFTATDGNRTDAAKRLGMSRRRLMQKLWDHGIVGKEATTDER